MGDLRFEVDAVAHRREAEPRGFVAAVRRRPLLWISIVLLPIVILLTWWLAETFAMVPEGPADESGPAFTAPGIRDGEGGERIFESEKVEFKFKTPAPSTEYSPTQKKPEKDRVIPLPQPQSEKGH